MSAPQAHLLAVDDDDRICGLLKRFLSGKGYAVTVGVCAADARRLMDVFQFDLIILDVMMPGEDGFSLLKGIRSSLQTPVILLTARGLPNERVQGLRIGADDYLSKPFEPEELALRIAAILKRVPPIIAASEEIKFSNRVFNLHLGELRCDNVPVHLTESDTRLLSILIEYRNIPLSRAELAKYSGSSSDRSVDVRINRLRRKLELDPAEPRYLKTVRGIGYMLKADD